MSSFKIQNEPFGGGEGGGGYGKHELRWQLREVGVGWFLQWQIGGKIGKFGWQVCVMDIFFTNKRI